MVNSIIKEVTKDDAFFNKDFIEKQKKVRNRNHLIRSTRQLFCQYYKSHQELYEIQQLFNEKLTYHNILNNKSTIKTLHRKNLPRKEINYARLSSELDVCHLLLDKNYFNHLLKVATQIRRYLSSEVPPIDSIVNAGAVPYLVKLINTNYLLQFIHIKSNDTIENNTLQEKPIISLSQLHNLQTEACWALTNIASGSSFHTNLLSDLGAIPLIVELLKSDNSELCDQAVWALGNIVGDSTKLRDYVLALDTIHIMVTYAFKFYKTLGAMERFSWSFCNMFRGKPIVEFDLVKKGYPLLQSLFLQAESFDMLSDCSWALYYMIELTDEIEDEVINKIIKLVTHPSAQICCPNIRSIGTILTGSEGDVERLIKANVLKALKTTLKHDKYVIRRETAWAISNILAEGSNHLKAVLEIGLVDDLIKMIKDPNERGDVKKECLWSISNATRGNREDVIQLSENYNLIDLFYSFLIQEKDLFLKLSLESFRNLLAVYLMEINLVFSKSKKEEAMKLHKTLSDLGFVETLKNIEKQNVENEEVIKERISELLRYVNNLERTILFYNLKFK
ncbi:hypothetical protein ABK040_002065 [Willaertia magna]